MGADKKNTQRPTVLLDHYLKRLKLPTFLREYKTTAEVCAKEGEDAIAFLARLCVRIPVKSRSESEGIRAGIPEARRRRSVATRDG